MPPRPVVAAAPAAPVDSGAAGRPLFVAPDAETVRREADEMAFATLQLTEETRAAIRQINDANAARVNALRNGVAANQSDSANNEAIPQSRRILLRQLLGVAAADRFEATEQAAAKRLHNRYRWQSLHGIAPGTASPEAAKQSP
jgi:hypothetical protein